VGRQAEAAQALSRQAALWPDTQSLPFVEHQAAIYFGTKQDRIAADKKYPVPPAPVGKGQPDGALMERAADTRDKTLIRRSINNCFETYGSSAGPEWDQLCLGMMVVMGELDDAFRFAELGYPDTRRLYPPDDDRWLISPPRGLDPGRLFAPKMAPFRNDPRFWQVALRTGLVNYWETTQQWPDFCRSQLEVCKARAADAIRHDATSAPSGAIARRPDPPADPAPSGTGTAVRPRTSRVRSGRTSVRSWSRRR
jgi:hypothetical protein